MGISAGAGPVKRGRRQGRRVGTRRQRRAAWHVALRSGRWRATHAHQVLVVGNARCRAAAGFPHTRAPLFHSREHRGGGGGAWYDLSQALPPRGARRVTPTAPSRLPTSKAFPAPPTGGGTRRLPPWRGGGGESALLAAVSSRSPRQRVTAPPPRCDLPPAGRGGAPVRTVARPGHARRPRCVNAMTCGTHPVLRAVSHAGHGASCVRAATKASAAGSWLQVQR